MENRAAKIALGTAVAGGLTLTGFLLFRKARGAEAEAAAARGEAASAAARAATATQAAYDANRRLQEANSLLAWTQAYARQAGDAAAAAVRDANQKAFAAQQAAAEAREAAAAAERERQTDRKVALQREAQLKTAHAAALQREAQTAANAAAAAEAEAQKRADAERRAVAATVEAEKLRQQTQTVALKEREVAEKRVDPTIVNMECSRQAVASGFQDLKTEVKRANPKFTDQQAVNTAATIMRKAGVVLEAPNAAIPFWQQPCQTVRALVQHTVNVYLEGVRGPAAVPATQPVPDKPVPVPTVTTDPNAAKRDLVKQAWTLALNYAMRVASAIGKPLSAQEALNRYGSAFRTGSQLGPGLPVAPLPSALNAPDPFWAQDLGTIKQALLRAYEATVKRVNIDSELIVVAFDSRGQLAWVTADDIQLDPAGKPIVREGAALAGKRTYYPVAKPSARVVDPAKELGGGGAGAAFAGAHHVHSYTDFGQRTAPFCTVV